MIFSVNGTIITKESLLESMAQADEEEGVCESSVGLHHFINNCKPGDKWEGLLLTVSAIEANIGVIT